MSNVTPAMRNAAVRAVGARVMLSDLPHEVQTAIGDLLHAATIVERERCAKIAERPIILDAMRGVVDVRPFGAEIAAEIRATKD